MSLGRRAGTPDSHVTLMLNSVCSSGLMVWFQAAVEFVVLLGRFLKCLLMTAIRVS